MSRFESVGDVNQRLDGMSIWLWEVVAVVDVWIRQQGISEEIWRNGRLWLECLCRPDMYLKLMKPRVMRLHRSSDSFYDQWLWDDNYGLEMLVMVKED